MSSSVSDVVAGLVCCIGVYLVIADGFVRIYDSEKTYMSAPLSFAEQFALTRHHTTTPIVRKAYNQNMNGGKAVDFFCFYLVDENSPLGAQRNVKININIFL